MEAMKRAGGERMSNVRPDTHPALRIHFWSRLTHAPLVGMFGFEWFVVESFRFWLPIFHPYFSDNQLLDIRLEQ